MKNISIEIGSVTVSGLPAGARDVQVLGRGIERAFGELLLRPGRSPRSASGLALPDLCLPARATDAEIARAVAAALHGMLGGRV